MAQQKQATKEKQDVKRRRKTLPQTEQVGEHRDKVVLPDRSLDANGDGNIGTQAARLADTRLQTTQRYALAAQIGRMAGNTHLQRAVATVAAHCAPTPTSSMPSGLLIQRFEGGEHLKVGDQAYAEALSAYITQRLEGVSEKDRAVMKRGLEAQFGKTLRRLSDQKGMSYGAATALSGDFYKTAEALYSDTEGWINNTDIDDLIEHFGSERETMEMGGVGEQYETSEVKKWWNSKDYVTLAEQNAPHFVGNTLSMYIDNHRSALDKAREAYTEKDEKNQDRLWEEARFLNAFADHFLTDSFCSGHLRVPREEITNFFKSLDFNEKEAGWMAKVVHDYDNTNGVAVRNARGDQWVAFGDKLLRADLDPSKKKAYTVTIMQGSKAVQTDKTGDDIVREAVQHSVMELLAVRDTGQEPKEYAALNLMPFVDWNKQSTRLEDVFNVSMSDKQRAEYIEKTGWKRHLAGAGMDEMDVLVRNFPRLMNEFHRNMEQRFKSSDKKGTQGEFAGVPKALREGLLSLGAQRLAASQAVKAVGEILRKETYLNDDEQKEIIALLKDDPAAAKQLSAKTRFECYKRFDPENYDRLLNIFWNVYHSWNYDAQMAEVRVHLQGRTNEQAEKTIVAILNCVSDEGWKQLLRDQKLMDWLNRDLTDTRYAHFKEMLDRQRAKSRAK